MNKKLIKLLSLDKDATDDQIVEAVAALVKNASEATAVNAREAAIQKKIVASGHALTREQAALSIENQAAYDAALAEKTKAKK